MFSVGRSGIMESPLARPSLGERHKNGLHASVSPRRPLRICSRRAIKYRPGLPGAKRIPDHMGRRDGRRHVEAPDFEDGKVGETSTVQDRCVLLSGSDPPRRGSARPGRLANRRRPGAAGWPAPATEMRSPDGPRCRVGGGQGTAGPCRRPASMPTVFPFLDGGRTFPELRGTREFGSAKRATVMHVHHG